MSLDIYLTVDYPVPKQGSGIYIRENGQTREISQEEWQERFPDRTPYTIEQTDENYTVYKANITHNLSKMAAAAGLVDYLWEPEKLSIKKAKELIEPLQRGLNVLITKHDELQQYNPKNGWGHYDNLYNLVSNYLIACIRYPDATVEVCR